MGRQTGKARRGFTLLELLVVISIIGILMAASVVTFVGVGRKVRFEGAAKALKDKMYLARNSAITRSRKFAIRATLTEAQKRWRIDIIDSVDNIFDNDDDRYVGEPYYMPRLIELEGEQEIEFTPEGGIYYSTSNPIMLTDRTNQRQIWKIPLTIYKAAGICRMGAIEKTNLMATAQAGEGEAQPEEADSLAQELGLDVEDE